MNVSAPSGRCAAPSLVASEPPPCPLRFAWVFAPVSSAAARALEVQSVTSLDTISEQSHEDDSMMGYSATSLYSFGSRLLGRSFLTKNKTRKATDMSLALASPLVPLSVDAIVGLEVGKLHSGWRVMNTRRKKFFLEIHRRPTVLSRQAFSTPRTSFVGSTRAS